ncbi:GyrI-like small molecule binding protein [Larkinella arboricola]|uniref:GyrI-like small molecule binding protein n=1 Tax=Larkinella arboricola TaxID=643671 RepID=A0A327X9U5_LARAB|nr:GyrI-like domain-containing protein [Larkinella arboricola]RAK02633.1 GyrI-like small molecule binding protein [Larkinella arboricola]
MQLKKAPSLTTLAFSTRTTLPELNAFVRTVARQLYREAVRLDLEITGPIIWQYDGVDGKPETVFQLDILLPIHSAQGEPADTLAFKTVAAFSCASVEHTGPWDGLAIVYPSLRSRLMQEGYQQGARSREVYINMDFENPANNVTEIQVQII